MCIVQEVDIAAGPLTVTSVRERVIDFTKPILLNHLAVLMKKSHAAQFGIGSIDDLASQSTVKYGVLADGATEGFFRTSRIVAYCSKVCGRYWRAMAVVAFRR